MEGTEALGKYEREVGGLIFINNGPLEYYLCDTTAIIYIIIAPLSAESDGLTSGITSLLLSLSSSFILKLILLSSLLLPSLLLPELIKLGLELLMNPLSLL